jgi:hypothetical protein
MMSQFVLSEVGACVVSLMFGVGVGLLAGHDSRRVRHGAVLVTVGFVVQLFAYPPERAVWAAPVFVIALGVAALLSDVARYGASPLLIGQSYWQKVALMLAHGRRIKSAARVRPGGSLGKSVEEGKW